jgi:hypothetical protein
MEPKCKWWLGLVCLLVVLPINIQAANSDHPSPPVPVPGFSIRHDLSLPLRDMVKLSKPGVPGPPREIPIQMLDLSKRARPQPRATDPLLGPTQIQAPMPSPGISFDGPEADDLPVVGLGRVAPPDTEGDVGPNHYVSFVNLVFEIFDKNTGTSILGPAKGSDLWIGFGGVCENNNDGDPIALYDQFAGRWVLSQFDIQSGTQCFAVSQTGDPTGSWHRYAFDVSPGNNDYPKIGVWPDAYYMTFNEFAPSFTQAVAVALEKDKMIQGLPAQFVKFNVPAPSGVGCSGAGDCYFSLQPSHVEGLTPPPAGAPNYFIMAFDDETWGTSPDPDDDFYKLWQFHADWSNPGSSTFTGPVSIATAEFDAEFCNFSRTCIPQPSPGTALDVLGQFTMYRLVYRKFGAHESLYVNHSVDVGSNRAGVRWTEIRSPGSGPAVFQTGTHAPADGHSRWMGSIAADKDGNLAIGYSISSSTLMPGIRYAGRLATDPLGTLPQEETSLHEGTGVQQATSSRWGDYSTLSIDESDDCTFWYTNEYYQTTGSFDWDTRIGKFKFPNCVQGPAGTLTGTVVSANNGNPIAGAQIQIGENFSTTTNSSGVYSMLVPVGTYDVTASKFGYFSQTAAGVVINDGQTTTQNFSLVPAASVIVDGFVTDGSGAGWPLYARLDFASSGPTTTVYTDPQNGYYAVTLVADASYTITVTAQLAGYLQAMRAITTGVNDQQEHFALPVDQASCSVEGYSVVKLDTILQTDFSSGIPSTWTVTSATTSCNAAGAIGQWNTSNPGLRANLTGGSGLFAIADSDDCGSSVRYDSNMETHAFDLSGFDHLLLIEFNSDYRDLCTPSVQDEVALQVFDGTNWVPVFTYCGPNGGVTNRRGPRLESFLTTSGPGSANARVRWRYKGRWDWWWEVDNVSVAKAECRFAGGGLIYGNVYDENTGLPLNGALVELDSGQSTVTGPTPDDPTMDDGFYQIYAPTTSGNAPSVRTMTVSLDRYGTVARQVIPTPNGSRREDFNLPAGLLTTSPAELRMRLSLGGSGERDLNINNSGGLAAQFSILELDTPAPSSDPGERFDEIVLPYDPNTKEGQLAAEVSDTRNLSLPAAPQVPAVQNAGEHVAEYLTTHAIPWGAGYNVDLTDFWVSNPAIGPTPGDDKDHRYLTDGTYTGDTVNVAGVGGWGGDMTYNARTRSLWQVKVGGDNCIFEIDPVAKVRTGRQICPAFGTSMRGLAYDAVRDIYYAGSWNGNQVVEFTPAGAILRRVNVGLGVSGLAFNGSTGHLFAQVNASTQLVYVLDANATGFTALSAFTLSNSTGGNAYGAFAGAGLEIDCAGNLWSVNQTTKKIHVNDSGERGPCVTQIPWLSENPSSGTVAAHSSMNSVVSFNSSGLTPGCQEAQLLVLNDTPYGSSTHKVGLTVAFNDVAAGSSGDAYIHALASAGVVTSCSAGNFCPRDDTTRRIMAVWLLRAKFGGDYNPPPATGIFGDVTPQSFGANYIEDLYRRGIDSGCGTKKGVLNFCPESAVTRGDLARLVLVTKEGTSYQPPPCTGIFRDVSCDDDNAAYIEEVYRRGIAERCTGGPPNQLRFCPRDSVDRALMSVQVGRTFGVVGCLQ